MNPYLDYCGGLYPATKLLRGSGPPWPRGDGAPVWNILVVLTQLLVHIQYAYLTWEWLEHAPVSSVRGAQRLTESVWVLRGDAGEMLDWSAQDIWSVFFSARVMIWIFGGITTVRRMVGKFYDDLARKASFFYLTQVSALTRITCYRSNLSTCAPFWIARRI